MGAEKWLDIELWDSPQECFSVLKSRGYRIATTHVGMDAVFMNLASFSYSPILLFNCLQMDLVLRKLSLTALMKIVV